MNKNSAIICEFNPLHKGHGYIIDAAREKSDDVVIAIMSGNFTQRAECAVFDKYTRAKAAVKRGVDLVLELPFPWCAAGAEFFAYGGVSIADMAGARRLVFGSETGDLEYLRRAAEIVKDEEYTEYIKGGCKEAGAAVLHDMAMKKFGFELGSNDKLAKEYIKASMDIEEASVGDFKAVKRINVGAGGIHTGASEIRKIIYSGGLKSARGLIEENAMAAYADKEEPDAYPEKLQEIEFLYFRLFSDGGYDKIFEASGGVGNRLEHSARISESYKDFYANAATKKYTNSRLRRAALYSIIGVTKEMLEKRPLFTVLLAANRRGREYLSSIRKDDKSAIITKPSDVSGLSNEAKIQYEVMTRADELYTLCGGKGTAAGEFLKRRPYIENI